MHLTYLGCGNYVQLLLGTVTYEYEIFGVSSPLNVDIVDMKLQIIGSLTADEVSTLSQLLNTGLKPNILPTQKKTSASTRSVSDLDRVKRELAIPTSSTGRKVPQSSTAIKLTVEPLVKVRKMSKEDILLAQQRVREEYSKLRSTAKAGKKSDKTKQAKRSVIPKRRGHFDVAVYKLQKRKHKYYYKCKIKECSASFSKTSAWNVHHLVKHKDIKFRCNECRKVLQTPSSFKNHQNLHKECCFECNHCDCKFIFCSKLRTHRSLHRWQKLYSCFAVDCNRSYKWRHDLLRHIKIHVKKILYSCKICSYKSYERRLYYWHIVVHTNKMPYKCRFCTLEYKHTMQRYRHEKKMHHS